MTPASRTPRCDGTAAPAPGASAGAGPSGRGRGAAAPAWAATPRARRCSTRWPAGRAAHAVWQALPGRGVGRPAGRRRAATVGAGGARCSSCPTSATSTALHAALHRARSAGAGVVALTAELGPAERYRRWLAVRRGAVAGRRRAPARPCSRRSRDRGCWPSGTTATTCTPSRARPTRTSATCWCCAPHAAGAALLVGGFARTAEAQVLVESGWARESSPTGRPSAPRRRGSTRRLTSDDQLARDPTGARRPAARRGVRGRPRRAGRGPAGAGAGAAAGYVPWLACAQCRETPRRRCRPLLPARARAQRGRGAVAPQRPDPAGRRAAAAADGAAGGAAFRCPACASRRLRAGVVGAGRTAEELGRAFPGAPVRTSGGSAPVLDRVPGRPDLVVATPGAEPPAEGGYGAALLLDGWAMLSRPDLRVAEETLRRWMARPRWWCRPPTAGRGRVVVVADAAAAAGAGPGPLGPGVARGRRAGRARRRSGSRPRCGWRRSRAPPRPWPRSSTPCSATRTAAGPRPPDVEVLGPVELDPEPGADPAARAPRTSPGAGAARAGPRAGGGARRGGGPALGRKAPDPVRVRLDPPEVG